MKTWLNIDEHDSPGVEQKLGIIASQNMLAKAFCKLLV